MSMYLIIMSTTDLLVLSAVNNGLFDKVKYAIIGLHRASRKALERRRVGALER